MNLPAMAVHELVKHFGDGVAVDNISFSVVSGEICALLGGGNGAGKTTTLSLLLGLLESTTSKRYAWTYSYMRRC